MLDGGRQRIHRAIGDDAAGLGYARLTDSDLCAFCAMLASRGPIYKNAAGAGRATNDRFAGDGAFKFHDHCACVAVPVFSRDEAWFGHAADLADQWK